MEATEMLPLGDFQVTVTAYRCRCGHEWTTAKVLQQSERPRVCPKCKSANWDRPYKFRKNAKEYGA
jgi:predicted Zn-ribbon and HTH transcriptional regulator